MFAIAPHHFRSRGLGLGLGVALTAWTLGARHAFVGTIEILGLVSGELHFRGGFWDLMANFNINKAGFATAGLFVGVWAVAIGYWKIGRVETRWAGPWSSGPETSGL